MGLKINGECLYMLLLFNEFLILTKAQISGESLYILFIFIKFTFISLHHTSIYRFKNNGENFHIKLPLKVKSDKKISVPEDLVQIQAYLRWERKGKQIYTPEQEKVSDEVMFTYSSLVFINCILHIKQSL